MPDMMRAVLLVTDLLERADRGSGALALTSGLSGTGIGDVAYEGTARVVADADEAFERVEPGDIIVARLTVPTFNSVLAMAGGVVTEGGGLLCHTAVIARELGIPAVVGVPGALTEIPDGARIEVDPVAGTVTVLTA
jgi:pyruvate,water dikinase